MTLYIYTVKPVYKGRQLDLKNICSIVGWMVIIPGDLCYKNSGYRKFYCDNLQNWNHGMYGMENCDTGTENKQYFIGWNTTIKTVIRYARHRHGLVYDNELTNVFRKDILNFYKGHFGSNMM